MQTIAPLFVEVNITDSNSPIQNSVGNNIKSQLSLQRSICLMEN